MGADDRKRLYKVVEKDMDAPFRDTFTYRVGKEYRCRSINTDVTIACAKGFYATDIDGLPYAYNIHRRVFECEVWGRRVEFDEFKRRYEYIRLVKEMSTQELIELAKPWDKRLEYRLSEVLNPINPASITPPDITEAHIELVRQWKTVMDSMKTSVWKSVWDSVRASARDSVAHSVFDSVSNPMSSSMWAYVGSLFTSIPKWKYIDHVPGAYPFQPAIDLWKQGLVPSYDDKMWRLYSSKRMDVLWRGTFN